MERDPSGRTERVQIRRAGEQIVSDWQLPVSTGIATNL